MPSAITLDSYSESHQPICAKKPRSGQKPAETEHPADYLAEIEAPWKKIPPKQTPKMLN